VDLLKRQNEELNVELEDMVKLDESIRMRLDRRGRVQELRSYNESHLTRSVNQLERSRSPYKR